MSHGHCVTTFSKILLLYCLGTLPWLLLLLLLILVSTTTTRNGETQARRGGGGVVIFLRLLLLAQGLTINHRATRTTSRCGGGGTTTSHMSSSAQDARVLARQIREQCTTLDQAWQLLRQQEQQQDLTNNNNNNNKTNNDNPPVPAVLHQVVASELLNLCAQQKDADAALEIVQLVPHSDICRARTISILGQCDGGRRFVDALHVLTMLPMPQSTSPYTSTLAALGKAKQWPAVLQVLHDMPPHLVSTVTLNAALQAMLKAKRPDECLALLRQASGHGRIRLLAVKDKDDDDDAPPLSDVVWPHATPDRTSFHVTLQCLAQAGRLPQACALIRYMQQQPAEDDDDDDKNNNNNVQPNADTYTRLTAALTPAQWTVVQELLPAMGVPPLAAAAPLVLDFQKWNLPKRGRGKSSYWELGTVCANHHGQPETRDERLIVALQPNRNPGLNGMKLAFYRQEPTIHGEILSNATTTTTTKLGYLLMINSPHDKTSQFLGQFVEQSNRGQGLAKIWLAIWLRLCLDAGLRPLTGKIRKPLLSLVLESTFGMIPQSGGVQVVISSGDKDGEVVLYSPSGQALEGAVSPLELRHQKMRLSLEPPDPPGRCIVLGCDYLAPDTVALEASVSAVLQGRFSLNQAAKQQDLSKYLLGI